VEQHLLTAHMISRTVVEIDKKNYAIKVKFRTNRGLDIKYISSDFIRTRDASPSLVKKLITFPVCYGQYLKKSLVVVLVVHIVHIFN